MQLGLYRAPTWNAEDLDSAFACRLHNIATLGHLHPERAGEKREEFGERAAATTGATSRAVKNAGKAASSSSKPAAEIHCKSGPT